MQTPFDHPSRLYERITFPTARMAYGMGHVAGVSEATPPPIPVEVKHRPGVDNGFYIVQEEVGIYDGLLLDRGGYYPTSPRRGVKWVNVAAFSGLDDANAKADERFTENAGKVRVQVIYVGPEPG